MKIVVGEIDQPTSGHRRDRAAANVPFHRHVPVEHGGTGRDLVDHQIDMLRDDLEGLADSRAGGTPVDRKQLSDQAVKIDGWLPIRCCRLILHGVFRRAHHSLRSASNGQAVSFSDSTVTGSGQLMPITGSSWRKPSVRSATYSMPIRYSTTESSARVWKP